MTEREHISMSLHGPGVTLDSAVEAGIKLRALLDTLAKDVGQDVHHEIVSVAFQCDGCGLRRDDRPGPDEGWTYRDGDDLCPACSAAA